MSRKGFVLLCMFLLILGQMSPFIASAETIDGNSFVEDEETEGSAETNEQSTPEKKIDPVKETDKIIKNKMSYEQGNKPEVIPGEYLIKGSNISPKLIQSAGAEYVENVTDELVLIKVSDGNNAVNTLSKLNSLSAVSEVQPNYKYYPTAVNDEFYNQLWGLHNTGQFVGYQDGKADIDIDMPEAWKLLDDMDLEEVVIAVIDTGLDYNHPDLKDVLWVNEAELNGEPGKDDDGNGIVDDIHGADFVNNSGDVYNQYDNDRHGTHVAGTIAASINNNIGISGIAPNVKIMSIKFLGANGGSTANAIKAINYAKSKNVKISNNSWGGGAYDPILYETIRDSGMLFIAAAGNESLNVDTRPSYPGAYDLDNILSVVAVDNRGNLASFSNYGSKNTDIAAPGVSILSTLPTTPRIFRDAVAGVEAVGKTVPYKANFNGVGLYTFAEGGEVRFIEDAISNFDLGSDSSILVVLDSDDYDTEGLTAWYKAALDEKGFTNYRFEVVAKNQHAPSILGNDFVVWDTGSASRYNCNTGEVGLNKILTDIDIQNMKAYLDAGGQLLLQGEDALCQHEFNSFVIEYLGIYYLSSNHNYKVVEWRTNVENNGNRYNLVDNIKTSDIIAPNANSSMANSKANLWYETYEDYTKHYDYYNGTSMAAPHVSGVAGLLLGVNPDLTWQEMKEILMTTGDVVLGAANTTSKRMVNAYKALDKVLNPYLSVDPISNTSKYITGTAKPNTEVKVKKGGQTVASARSLANGTFVITLSKPFELDDEVVIEVVVDGEVTEKRVIITEDLSAPALLKEMVVKDTDKSIKGQLNEFATISYNDGKKDIVKQTDQNGNFTLTVTSLINQKSFTFGVCDALDNCGMIEIPIVDTTKPVLKNIDGINTTSTIVSFSVSENATLEFFDGDRQFMSAPAYVGGDYGLIVGNYPFFANYANKSIVIKIKDEAGNYGTPKTVKVVADTVGPKILAPTKFELRDNESYKYLQLNEPATILFTVNGETTSFTTDMYGRFSGDIPLFEVNSKVTMTLIDGQSNKSTQTITVLDGTPPRIVEINPIYNTSKIISGKTTEKATVDVRVDGKTIGKVTTANDGTFTFKLPKLLNASIAMAEVGGVELVLTDFAKPKANESKYRFSVLNDTIAPILYEFKANDVLTFIEGRVSEEATVTITAENGTTLTTKTDLNGKFKVNTKKLTKSTALTVELVDLANNKKVFKEVVKDGVVPVVVEQPKLYNTSEILRAKFSEEVNVEIQYTKDNKTWTALEQTYKTNNNELTVDLNGLTLTANMKFKLIFKDEAGNNGKELIATVQADKVGPKLVTPKEIDLKNDGSNIVEGKVDEAGTLEIIGYNSTGPITIEKDGQFNVELSNLKANQVITFRFTDKVGNKTDYKVTVKDVIAPELVEKNTIYNSSRTLIGQVSKKGQVTAFVNGKSIGTAKTDNAGNFNITLKSLLPAGTEITLNLKDEVKPKPLETNVVLTVVEDIVAPEVTNLLSNDSLTYISGKLSEEGTVSISKDGVLLTKTPIKTDVNGNFKVTIPKQKAGTTLQLTAVDLANNSTNENVDVLDVTAPVIQKVNSVLDSSLLITGQISEAGFVSLYDANNQLVTSVDASEDGKFTLQLTDYLVANTTYTLVAVDKADLASKAFKIKVTADKVAPTLTLKQLFSTSTTLTGTVNETATIEIYQNGSLITTQEVEVGNFEIQFESPIAKNTRLTIVAIDVKNNKRTVTHTVK